MTCWRGNVLNFILFKVFSAVMCVIMVQFCPQVVFPCKFTIILLQAEKRMQAWTVLLSSDGVYAYYCFFSLSLSLFIVGVFKEIVPARSPELKPAKAHVSYSLCYMPWSPCDFWLFPSFSSINHCHQSTRLSCGVHAALLLHVIYSVLRKL